MCLGAMTGDSCLYFSVLGTFRVDRDGQEIDLGPRLQRTLLAILLVDAGHVVPVDRLIDLLWREEPPSAASASVQVYISQLRRVLEPGRLARAPARVLVTQDPGYALWVADDQVDALRFRALARQAHSDLAAGQPAVAAAGLEEALALWRGDPLPEFASQSWAVPLVTQLVEAHDLAAEDRSFGDPGNPWREPQRIVLDSCLMLVTGTLADHAEEMTARLAQPDHPSVPHLAAAAAALGFTLRGDEERARQIAARWFAPPPRSWAWPQAIAFWAQVAIAVGVPDPGWLYDLLKPHAGELAIVGVGADCGGAVDSLLAGLAWRLGHLGEAAERAQAGLALETRLRHLDQPDQRPHRPDRRGTVRALPRQWFSGTVTKLWPWRHWIRARPAGVRPETAEAPDWSHEREAACHGRIAGRGHGAARSTGR